MERPEITWHQDDEQPNQQWADIGKVSVRVADGDPVEWSVVIAGLENTVPGSWLKGTAEDIDEAKEAVVELIPVVLATATGWVYDGMPGWVITAMQPAPKPRVTTPAQKAAVCRRIGENQKISLDPVLVADVVELTPEHEGDLVVEYGHEALVKYYCPHDPRLREIRPQVSSSWIHAKSEREYQVVGIGRLQTAHRSLDMAEVVLYGNPGNPLIWVRPLDEFMDGRFQVPPEKVVKEVDVQNRPDDHTMVMVKETDDLYERDDGTGASRAACRHCGQWVGTYHTPGCEGENGQRV